MAETQSVCRQICISGAHPTAPTVGASSVQFHHNIPPKQTQQRPASTTNTVIALPPPASSSSSSAQPQPTAYTRALTGNASNRAICNNTPNAYNGQMPPTSTSCRPIDNTLFEYERRLRLFLDTTLGELGVFLAGKTHAARDRASEQLSAFEQRLFERIGALENARNLGEYVLVDRVGAVGRENGLQNQQIVERLQAVESAQVLQEKRLLERLDGLADTIAKAVTKEITENLKVTANDRDTGAKGDSTSASASNPAVSPRSSPPIQTPTTPIQETIPSPLIILRLSEQNKALKTLRASVDKATTELGDKINALETKFLDVSNRDKHIREAVDALGADIKTRLNHSDALLVKLANVVGTARDESFTGKEELASLLRDASKTQLEKFGSIANDLQDLKGVFNLRQKQRVVESDVETDLGDITAVNDTMTVQELNEIAKPPVHTPVTSRRKDVQQPSVRPDNRSDSISGSGTLDVEISSSMTSETVDGLIAETLPPSQLAQESPVNLGRNDDTQSRGEHNGARSSDTSGEKNVSSADGGEELLESYADDQEEIDELSEEQVENIIEKESKSSELTSDRSTSRDLSPPPLLTVIRSKQHKASNDRADTSQEKPKSHNEQENVAPQDSTSEMRTRTRSSASSSCSGGKVACPYACGNKFTMMRSLNEHLSKSRCRPGRQADSGETAKKRKRPSGLSDAGALSTDRQVLRPRNILAQQDSGSNKRFKVMDSSTATSSSSSNRYHPDRLRVPTGKVLSNVTGKETVPLQRKAPVIWPVKAVEDDLFDRQMIQCDKCDSFYHYRCTGVLKGDRRLNENVPFTCTHCLLGNHTGKEAKVVCSRPDCDWIGQRDGTDFYTIEKIVGRMITAEKDSNGRETKQTRWLIKWHGYGIPDCTWAFTKDIPDVTNLIPAFSLEASKEKKNLNDPKSKVVFLDEVRHPRVLAAKWPWIIQCETLLRTS